MNNLFIFSLLLFLPNLCCGENIAVHLNKNNQINLNLRHSIPEYTAKYKIYWHGIKVGYSLHTVNKKANQHYLASIASMPIIKLLPFNYAESSEFIIQNQKIIPLEYQFDNQEHGATKHGALYFDWQQQKLIDLSTQEALYNLNSNINASNSIQDKLSHIFQLQADLRKYQSNNLSYSIAKTTQINIYQFKILGEEIISTKLGKLDTLKLEQTTIKENNIVSNRSTILWLAKSLDLLVVQSKQYKKNKLMGWSVIEEYELLN